MHIHTELCLFIHIQHYPYVWRMNWLILVYKRIRFAKATRRAQHKLNRKAETFSFLCRAWLAEVHKRRKKNKLQDVIILVNYERHPFGSSFWQRRSHPFQRRRQCPLEDDYTIVSRDTFAHSFGNSRQTEAKRATEIIP